MSPAALCVRQVNASNADAVCASELMLVADESERAHLQDEITAATTITKKLLGDLRALLDAAHPAAGKNVIIEIRGAEGGEDANLFAEDLFRMYQEFAALQSLQVSVLSLKRSSLGGVVKVVFVVKGARAWSLLRFEAGTHRVQRVSATERQGRMHTSTATVMMFPEASPSELVVPECDLRVDVYCASGNGGQKVNKTASAVRITHIPSGVVVAMQDDRSQLRNRVAAMRLLRSRLLQMRTDAQVAQGSVDRLLQVGAGGRSDKVRTYNVKENRVTDHRVGLSFISLQNMLAGDMSPVVDALTEHHLFEQLRCLVVS